MSQKEKPQLDTQEESTVAKGAERTELRRGKGPGVPEDSREAPVSWDEGQQDRGLSRRSRAKPSSQEKGSLAVP